MHPQPLNRARQFFCCHSIPSCERTAFISDDCSKVADCMKYRIIQLMMQLLHFSVLYEHGEIVLLSSEQTEKSLRVWTFLKLHGALDYFRLAGANLLFYFPIWHLLAQNEEAMAQNLVKLLLTTATNLPEYPPVQTEPHRWSDPGISCCFFFIFNEWT